MRAHERIEMTSLIVAFRNAEKAPKIKSDIAADYVNRWPKTIKEIIPPQEHM